MATNLVGGQLQSANHRDLALLTQPADGRANEHNRGVHRAARANLWRGAGEAEEAYRQQTEVC